MKNNYGYSLLLLIAGIGCQSGPRAQTPSVAHADASKTGRIAGPTSVSESSRNAGEQTAHQPADGSAFQAGASAIAGSDDKDAAPAIEVRRANKVSLVSLRQAEPLSSPPSATAAPLTEVPAPPPDEQPASRNTTALSLGQALETGLSQNPALVTLRGTANVSAAMADVARVYPWNPFVQAQYFPNGSPFVPSTTPGGGAGMSNYYVWAMQRIELGHQTRHRTQSAVAALGQVRWNIRQAELLNVATTERLFFTALYQRQLRDAAVDAAILNERLLGIVERRYKAGLALGAEQANARVAARQTRRQADLAEASYQAALLAVRQQLGIDLDTPIDVSGNLKDFQWLPVEDAIASLCKRPMRSRRDVAAEVVESRPDVMAARAGISVARANLNLARGARIQDIQAGPIYETGDDGTKYIGFRLQRDFGVFNNGGALVRQRQAEVGQQNLTHEQLKRQAALEAHAAIERYQRARSYVAKAAAEISGTTPIELEEMAAQFEAGQADILNLIAIQNNLLMDERSYLDLLNEVAQSAATVTLTTGLPPESFVSPRQVPTK
jgi:outer membrane protein TolC